MKVLIVEDELLIAVYLEELVTGFGHQVCALAASAPEAAERSAQHLPDVILMDIRLAGGTSGIDAARTIYSRHGIRCIFLSGNLDNVTQRALEPFKPIAFLGKPILPARLRRALEMADQERRNKAGE